MPIANSKVSKRKIKFPNVITENLPTRILQQYFYLLRLAARFPWPFLGGPFPRRFSISSFDKRLVKLDKQTHHI